MKFFFGTFLCASLISFALFASGATPATPKTAMSAMPELERGKMLVSIGGCHDCHSPKTFSDKGPEIDNSRILSGHPADQKLPDLPTNILGPTKWGAVTSNDFTAWVGPWGVSFTANLTPDKETGLGSWTEQMFMQAMRTGKHMGAPQGRPILPPMPWSVIGSIPDQDLHAIWVYLRSIPPIKNAVQDPIPPQSAK